MGLLNIYDTVSNKYTTIKATGKLKDILPDVVFSHSLVLKAGNRLNGDYEVTEDDVLYIRKVPGSTAAIAVVSIVIAVIAVGVGVGSAIYANKQAEEAKKQMEKAQRDAQNLAQQTQQLPFIRGAKNRCALGEAVQFVMGSVYNTPYNLTNGFYSIGGTDGVDSYYNAAFSCGYNSQKITELLIGNESICKRTNGISGELPFDNTSIYFKNNANRVEVRQPGENLTLTNCTQKINATYSGAELKHNYDEDAVPVIVQAADNAMKIQVCIQFSALRRYSSSSEIWKSRLARVSPYWSNDGGETWNLFTFEGSETKIIDGHLSFNNFERNVNHSIRFVAEKTFTAAESFGKQISIKVVKDTPKEKTQSQEDCCLLWYQTFCYDAQKSSANNLVECNILESELHNKTTRVAYRIIADDSTQDILDELHCITDGKARTWNGTSWSNTKSSTRNPASWLLEILTSDVHQPSKIADEQINLASFGSLYEYCSENSFYCDGIITKNEKKKDVIEKILKTCNATLIINNEGLYEICIDKVEENPVALLNTENIVSFSFSKSLAKTVDGTKVTFTNRDSWTVDTFYSMLDGGSYDYTTDTVDSLAIDYVTDYSHAYKVAQRQLRQRQLQPREIKVDVGHEGDYYPLYSTVLLQLPHLLQGLRSSVIKAFMYNTDGAITKIEISDLVDFVENTRYGIIIQATNDSGHKVYYAEVINTELTDSTRILTLEEPLDISLETIVPEKGNHLSFGTLDANGQFSKITNTMKIYGIEPNGKDGFTLTLRDYNEEVYNFTPEGIPIPEYKSNIIKPQQRQKNVSLNDFNELKNQINKEINGILTEPEEIGNPANVDELSAIAEENGISLKWESIPATSLQNAIKHYNVEISKNNGQTWTALGASATNQFFYSFTRAGENADGYPEASVFNTWRFRVRAESIYGKTSESWTIAEVDKENYGTWIIPNLSVIKETIDRTVILTVVFTETIPEKLYGHNQLKVWIKRNGNLDNEGGQSFNQLLGITPDSTWYTPEFNKSVMGSESENTEKNYHKFDTSGTAMTVPFETSNYKISHTLPLIGQCPRLYNGTTYVGITADVLGAEVPSITEVTTIPVSAEENAIVLFSGTTTETYTEGKYYKYTKVIVEEQEQFIWQEVTTGFIIKFTGTTTDDYKKGFYYVLETVSSELVWTELIKKNPTIVPTEYVYKITMFNESCETYPQNASEASDTYVQALCTNIADIVHSHEHYKDLYVEKLSAINANIGMITQGGMGSFEDMMNCWALSDLSPEDSGTLNGVMRGTFRVGDENEYFRVTPYIDPEDSTRRKYRIELKAGNIELSSDISGDSTMDFTNGTFIYNAEKTARMALSPNGITVQKKVYSEITPIGTENPKLLNWYEQVDNVYVLTNDTSVNSQKTYYRMSWGDISTVYSDEKDNMIITNADKSKRPSFGFQETGTIYHFDDYDNPENEEVEEGQAATNPQNIDCSGEVVSVSDPTELNPLVESDTCFSGVITKDDLGTNSFEGNIVFFSKSEKIVTSGKMIDIDGTVDDSPDFLTGYNEAMRETSTIVSGETVGAYLGLTAEQVQKGIFY